MAESFPNRIYQHAAQTDRIDNTFFISTLPTIWDRLAQKGLKGRYYYSDVPVLALWGAKYISISRPFPQFLFDCATNNLPHVAFVDPQFLETETGTVNGDHPHADIRNGQAFVNLVYRAVTLSRGWSKTVLVVTYDEWGGFFDHVAPPAGPVPTADRLAGNTDGLLGFRVPALLIAPAARRKAVSSISFDHTSILKLIEWRWGLQPLSVRDASANNLAAALDFNQRQLAAPQFAVPSGRFGSACSSSAPASRAEFSDKWLMLKSMARSHGWLM
jgi:phospholipase C